MDTKTYNKMYELTNSNDIKSLKTAIKKEIAAKNRIRKTLSKEGFNSADIHQFLLKIHNIY